MSAEFTQLENLHRLPFHRIYDFEGSVVALFTGNNHAHVGRIKTVAARTRGNTTLAISKVRVVRRNGRETKHHETPLWIFNHGEKEQGFVVIEEAPND